MKIAVATAEKAVSPILEYGMQDERRIKTASSRSATTQSFACADPRISAQMLDNRVDAVHCVVFKIRFALRYKSAARSAVRMMGVALKQH
ncbi:MAG: hypothetical protein EPN75_07955 [Beijerinckiaceae bacterium]|nr:MAG: hypothetical protein EPN75_07955 [Beijerinckiaceae bacterium]